MSTINEGILDKNQAKNQDNSVLQALEAYRVKKAFDEAKDAVKAYRATSSDAVKDKLVNLRIGIGSSLSRSESTVHTSSYAGGSVSSDGSVVVQALSDTKGTIQAVGETIKGDTVLL